MPPPPRLRPATLLELVLIEPGVYRRVLALDYQAEQFEVFHRRGLTRWVHYLGTPLILWALLLLTAGHRLGPFPGPLVAAAALAAWYLRLDLRVGLAASLEVGLLALLASLAADQGLTAAHALAVLAVAAAAQNLSHSVEPVPPVLTGRGFEGFPAYWARASGAHRVRLLALNLCYLPLEVVSAPRLFPVHVLRALHRLGWRPGWAEDVRTRAAAILEGG